MVGIFPDLLFFILETHLIICSGVIFLNLKGSFFSGIKDRDNNLDLCYLQVKMYPFELQLKLFLLQNQNGY